MTFLPENYEPTQSGNQASYFKIKKGENKFRILSPAMLGLEIWTLENKPERHKLDSEFAKAKVWDTAIYKAPPKEFWAFLVWNYEEKAVQIASITQKTIQGQLQSLVQDEDWGDPKEYDIKIKRTGDGMETEYSVQPVPAKPLDAEIVMKLEMSDIDLEQLFLGNDPISRKKPVQKEVDPAFA